MVRNSRLPFTLPLSVLLSSLVIALGVAPQASAIPDGDSPTLDIDCNAATSVAGTITDVEVGDILWVRPTNGNDALCTLTFPVDMFSVTQAGGSLSGGVLGLATDSRMQILLSGDFTITYTNATTRSYRVDACSLVGSGTVGSPWLVDSEAADAIAGVTETLANRPSATSADDLNANGFIDSCPASGEYLRTWSPGDDDESDGDGSDEAAPGVLSHSLPATGVESSESKMLLALAAALTLGGVLLLLESRRRRLGSRTDPR